MDGEKEARSSIVTSARRPLYDRQELEQNAGCGYRSTKAEERFRISKSRRPGLCGGYSVDGQYFLGMPICFRGHVVDPHRVVAAPRAKPFGRVELLTERLRATRGLVS